jgi:hypothetical protein
MSTDVSVSWPVERCVVDEVPATADETTSPASAAPMSSFRSTTLAQGSGGFGRLRTDRLFAGTEALAEVAPVLVHADLGPGHLLCREGRLAGVIDWGDAVVGDAALDFAWLLNAHPRGREILAAYSGRVDEGFVERALFYHRLAPWYEADYGLVVGRRASLEGGWPASGPAWRDARDRSGCPAPARVPVPGTGTRASRVRHAPGARPRP